MAKKHQTLTQQKYRTLTDYFEQTGRSRAALGRTLGISRSYVSLIADGKREPGLELALEIVRITGVPMESLIRREAMAS